MPPGVDPAAKRKEYHSNDFPHSDLADVGKAFDEKWAHVNREELAEEVSRAAAINWQRFHRRNNTGLFFKPRHFVTRAFPDLLLLRPDANVLETGAGNGSNATLLEAMSSMRLFVSDIAGASLLAVSAHPALKANEQRVTLFTWDLVTGGVPAGLESSSEPKAAPSSSMINASVAVDAVFASDKTRGSARRASSKPQRIKRDPPESESRPDSGGSDVRLSYVERVRSWAFLPPELNGEMDAALLMFVLSAIHPKHHAAALRNVFSTLKPGGLLCFRDYGLYDLAQLRAGEENILTPKLHVRGDGTLAYYFSLDEVRQLLTSAGFEVQELEFCTIRSLNRKKGITLDRVWVHAKAIRPI